MLLLLAALAALGASAGPTHRCIHGLADLQADAARALKTTAPQRYEDRVGAQASSGREALRIVAHFGNLYDPTKYCTAVGDVRPNYAGSTEVCTADDVLTDSKRNFLQNDIVPDAIRRLGAALNVTRVMGPLMVPSTTVCGADTAIPTADVSPGVPNADFVLYVTAGPLGDSRSTTLAFAAPCASDGGSPIPRPVVGRANFNPRYLTANTVEPSAANTLARDTGLHEICHALGFTPSFFSSMTSTGTIRGKAVTWFNGPTVTAACHAYFNCTAQTPCAEIEDEGPAGSRGTHWDKRMTFSELMVASGGAYLSAFTLSMFYDMGMYTPVYANAQIMVAERDAGCPFLQEKCNVPQSNPFGEWCFVADVVGCTPDGRAIGPCTIVVMSTPWPPEFRYFSNPNEGAVQVFTDGCPYRVPFVARRCSFIPLSLDVAIVGADFYFGPGGRCIEVDGLRRTVSVTFAGSYRCLRVRCPYGGERVEILVDTTWVACPLDGSAGTVSAPVGFVGTLQCPATFRICTDDIIVGTSVVPVLPDGQAVIPYNGGFIYITVTVRFNGTAWSSILSNRLNVNPVSNAVRIDMGVLLRVGAGALQIRQTVALSNAVEMRVGLIDDGTNSLTSAVINPALNAVLNVPSAFPTVNTVYRRYASETIALVYANAATDDVFLCGSTLSDSVCVLVVTLTVGLSVALVLLMAVCCVCITSPFPQDDPPVPTRLNMPTAAKATPSP